MKIDDKAALVAAASATAASEAMAKGNSFYAAGNFDEAIVQYLKAITIEPKNPIARRNLTAVLYEQGD
ncbi:hypothetical protein FPQ18DRAFT_389660 [Pyronema domesticum]|nr:hypothetical protein FPQ18DRAFT_389660 [Pyronema domesticum]